MNKKFLSLYITIIVLFLLFGSFIISGTNAAEFSKVLLRLDRLKENTTTGGMICAQPSTNETETSIAITFPSDFTVNSSVSNWTVSTSNIPSNSTAWPGISTSTSISDKTVTFSSSNLSTGTYYCFNFSSSNTLTTSSTGDKTGTIETKDSGGTVIDSTNYGFTIQADDQISVTALIAASSTDFEATISLSNSGDSFPQDTTLTYTITYGSNLAYNSNITVEAEWSLGTISGSGTPTLEIVDYVVNSATNGYNSSPAVIDTVNRTITWTISSFPASTTGETVTFQLKTNDNYTGALLVNFDVLGRVLGPGTQTTDSTISKNYKYNPGIAPTSAPQATNTPAPGTSSITTPTPTLAIPLSLIFLDIAIKEISENTGTISINTSKPTRIEIHYGTSPNFLNNSLTSQGLSSIHSVKIEKLQRNTTYYFKITAIDSSGASIISDIFILKTALTSENIPLLIKKSITVSSNNRIIFKPNFQEELGEEKDITVVLPTNQPYGFSFSLEEYNKVKRITAHIKSLSILGINNIGSNDSMSESDIEIFEVLPGVYSGHLISKQTLGIYSLYIKIYDSDGNISEQEIGKIKIVKPFTILDNLSLEPIENAQVTLFIYNPKTKLFNIIKGYTLLAKNPNYSESDGTIKYTLPNGRYLAKISAIGYEDSEIEFQIGHLLGEKYPEVILEKKPFSFFTQTQYYLATITDVYAATKRFVEKLAISTRFFDLILLSSLSLISIIVIFSFSVRTRIPVTSLPFYFIFHFRDILSIRHSDHISGEVIDYEHKNGIPGATVQLFDQETGKLISSTQTNKLGEFIAKKNADVHNYKIVADSKEYHGITLKDYHSNALSLGLKLELIKKGEETKLSLREIIASGSRNIIGFSFELLFFLSLLFEVLFISTIGLSKTLPYITISIITILLWIFYARRVLRRRLAHS